MPTDQNLIHLHYIHLVLDHDFHQHFHLFHPVSFLESHVLSLVGSVLCHHASFPCHDFDYFGLWENLVLLLWLLGVLML